MNRENIYQSVFNRVTAATWAALPVSGATGFKTASRKLVAWDAVSTDQMPALYQQQMRETVTRQPNLPPKWALQVRWYVYVAHLASQDGSATLIPSVQLNAILDAIQAAIEPQTADGPLIKNTLGGLAYEAKIVGTVENFEGDLGDFGVLVIPAEILVPL